MVKLGFIKRNNILKAMAFLCLFIALSLSACGKDEIIEPSHTGPIETVEASSPATETIDYSADEAETIESTASH